MTINIEATHELQRREGDNYSLLGDIMVIVKTNKLTNQILLLLFGLLITCQKAFLICADNDKEVSSRCQEKEERFWISY